MGKIKQLIAELHRRSLWQVLAIYLGACWLVLQVAEHVIEQFSMPEWTYGAALLLLLVGLPVVLGTAIVQEGGAPATRPDASERGTADGPAPGHDPEGLSGFLTWRNAILGGVGASMVWTLFVVAWVMFGAESVGPGAGPSVPAATDSPEAALGVAAEPLPDRDTAAGGLADVAAGDPVDRSAEEERGAGEPPEDAATEPLVEEGEPRREARGAAAPPEAERRPSTEAVPPSLREARSEAQEARAAALAGGAGTLAVRAVQRGDSLGELATRDSVSGRYGSAERRAELARAAYDEARAQAASAWEGRLDSARSDLEVLRANADRLSDAYADGSRRQEEAARRAGSGDYAGALTALREAATLYRRAHPGAAEPPDAGDSAAATPPAPEPRDVVRATLDRLERALEAEDMASVRQLWVTLSVDQARNFERFFEAGRDFDVGFEIDWETLAASDGAVTVRIQTTWEYHDESARRRVEAPPFEQTMRFEEREGGWVIATP